MRWPADRPEGPRLLRLFLAALLAVGSFPFEVLAAGAGSEGAAGLPAASIRTREDLDTEVGALQAKLAALRTRPGDVSSPSLAPLSARLSQLRAKLEELSPSMKPSQDQDVRARVRRAGAELKAFADVDACLSPASFPASELDARSAGLLRVSRSLVESEAADPAGAPWLALLKARTDLLERRVGEAATAWPLKPRVERLRLIASTVEAARGQPSRSVTELLLALLKHETGLGEPAGNEGLRTLAAGARELGEALRDGGEGGARAVNALGSFFDTLRAQWSKDPALAERIQDAQEAVLVEVHRRPRETPTDYPAPGRNTLAVGPVPELYAAAPARSGGSSGVLDAGRAALPSLKGAQEAFAVERDGRRGELLALALAALEESRQPAGGLALEQADKRLIELARDLPVRWPTEAAGPAELDRALAAFFQGLHARGLPALFRYFEARLGYRRFLFEAIWEKKRDVADGARFEPWELGQDPAREAGAPKTGGAARSVLYRVVKDGGLTFYGLTHEFGDGSHRFEGFTADKGPGRAKALIVTRGRVETPAGLKDVESQTFYEFGADGRANPSQRSVLLRESGRIVQKRLEESAKAFTTVIDYGPDGKPVKTSGIDGRTGYTTTEDLAQGVRTFVEPSGKMTIVPLEPEKSDWRSQIGVIDPRNGFVLQTIVHRQGTTEFFKPGLARQRDPAGKVQGYQVKVEELQGLTGQKRWAKAQELARHMVDAFGGDSASAKPLASLLFDLKDLGRWIGAMSRSAEKIPRKGAPTLERVAFDPAGLVTVVLGYGDGQRELLQVRYLNGFAADRQGRKQGAWVLPRPVRLEEKAGKTQTVGAPSPLAWRAYLAEGELNEYLEPSVEYKDRTFLSDQEIVRAYVRHSSWKGDRETGRWSSAPQDKTLLSEVTRTIDGTSWASAVGAGIDSIPVVGSALKGSGELASFAWNGLNYAPYAAVAWATGNENAQLTAAGFRANMPWLSHDTLYEGLSERGKAQVDERVRKQREKSLRDGGLSALNVLPETFDALKQAAGSAEERKGALAHWGSYSGRVFEAAAATDNALLRYGGYALGGAAFVVEKGATLVLDVSFWATMGLGAGIKAATQLITKSQAATVTLGVGRGARVTTSALTEGGEALTLAVRGRDIFHLKAAGFERGLRAAQGAEVGLTAVYGAPMGVGAVDNLASVSDDIDRGDVAGGIRHVLSAGIDGYFAARIARHGVDSVSGLAKPLPKWGEGKGGAPSPPLPATPEAGGGPAPSAPAPAVSASGAAPSGGAAAPAGPAAPPDGAAPEAETAGAGADGAGPP
ncbi:MAG: hypothetical protein HY554_16200, partial [Elusimicrobia bacterium]|nr:hypothetical protein [Elusimicrobiota bacterium]